MINPDYSIRGRHDYLPFGEEIETTKGGRSSILGYGAIEFRQKFTSKERDLESSLDYFLARYFSGPQGRFVIADSGPYDLSNPQSFNRYTYGLNNPLRFIDPNGEAVDYVIDNKNKTITLKLRVTIYGPNATQKNADQMKKKIESTWQGKTRIGKEKYTVKTEATVEVYDPKTNSGGQNPNWVYITGPGVDNSHFEGRPEYNKGTTADPRWVGIIDLTTNSESHEAGHMMGLGDDYYSDNNQATPGHSGHLMAGAPSRMAAQDELDRISSHISNRGQSKGTIIWLPGSKTAYQNTRERNAQRQ